MNYSKLYISIGLILIFGLKHYVVLSQETPEIDSLLNCLQVEENDTVKVNLMLDISEAYRSQNDPEDLTFVNKALKFSERINYQWGIAQSYKIMGIQAFYKGTYNDAITLFEKAIALFSEINDKKSISDCFKKIGIANAYLSDYDKAISSYQKALAMDEIRNDTNGIAVCFNDIGVLYNYQGNHIKSIEYQLKSIEICNLLNDKKAMAARLINLGASYDDMGNYADAIICYEDALVIKIDLDDKRGISNCYNNLGEVYNDRGDYEKAIVYYEKSFKIDQQLDDKEATAISLINIGNVHRKQEHLETALAYYSKSLDIAISIGNKRIQANSLNLMGELLMAKKEYEQASIKLKEAYDISLAIGDNSELAKSVFYMGEVFLAREKFYDAIKNFKQAFAMHKDLGEQNKMAAAIIKAGSAYYLLGNYNKALESGSQGLEIAQQIDSKENIRLAAELLAKTYSASNNFKNAYKYSVLFKQTHDSIFTLESRNKLFIVENRFELERKQQEIDFKNLKLEKQEAIIQKQKIQHDAQRLIIIGVLAFILLIAIGYLRLRKAKNIIAKQMLQIEEANEELNQTNEELNVTLDLNRYQKNQIENKNKEITDSIHYAKYIQRAILPKKEKLEVLLSDYFILYKPKNIVSGDFYWLTELEGRKIIAVADCTGHGVPGAFMSMLGVSFLNDIINKEYMTQPAIILKRLRKEVINALQQQGKFGEQRDGMDIGICSINSNTFELQFSGANTPLYIIRSKSEASITGAEIMESETHVLYELKGDKMPIALYEKMDKFSLIELPLIQGDCIYMFSDGFADQFGGPEGKRLKYKPFKELLLTNCQKPMKEQLNELEKVFVEWQNGQEQIDDILVMGFKI